jgi:hypothetical protein
MCHVFLSEQQLYQVVWCSSPGLSFFLSSRFILNGYGFAMCFLSPLPVAASEKFIAIFSGLIAQYLQWVIPAVKSTASQLKIRRQYAWLD